MLDGQDDWDTTNCDFSHNCAETMSVDPDVITISDDSDVECPPAVITSDDSDIECSPPVTISDDSDVECYPAVLVPNHWARQFPTKQKCDQELGERANLKKARKHTQKLTEHKATKQHHNLHYTEDFQNILQKYGDPFKEEPLKENTNVSRFGNFVPDARFTKRVETALKCVQRDCTIFTF